MMMNHYDEQQQRRRELSYPYSQVSQPPLPGHGYHHHGNVESAGDHHQHQQDTSFNSHRSTRTGATGATAAAKKKAKAKIEPYVSPFVLDAKRRAEERARLARERLRAQKPRTNAWDQDVKAPGYFDPQLRKQEIFRHEAKNVLQEHLRRRSHSPPQPTNHYHISAVGNENVERPANIPSTISYTPKMTMRTQADSPRRVPAATSTSPGTHNPPTNFYPHQRPPGYSPHQHASVQYSPPPQQHQQYHTPSKGGVRVDSSSSPFNQQQLPAQYADHNTSPFNENLVQNILRADPQHPFDRQFQVQMPQPPQQQGIPRPPQTPSVYDQFLMQQQQQLDSNPQRRVKDIQGHYTQLIRERLRNLLQKHRGGAQQDDDDLDNEAPPASTSSRPKISMKNRHFQQHPTVAPYDYQQQQFTKDMMTSMAKLMTAVGDIVTNNAENNSRGRRSRSRGRSRSRSANKRSSSLPPEVQKLQDKQDFVLQMAAALNPNSKNNLPKNKSGVMDMIMSKLQSIEKCEREIQSFLAEPKPVPTLDDILDGIQLQPPPKHNVENAQAVDLNRKFDDVAQEHKRDDASTISMMSNAVMSDKKNDYSKIITCFPQLKRLEDQQVNDEIMQYQKELEKVRTLKEVAFHRKNTTSRITGDNLSNEIFDRIVKSVAEDLDSFFDHYTEKFVNKV